MVEIHLTCHESHFRKLNLDSPHDRAGSTLDLEFSIDDIIWIIVKDTYRPYILDKLTHQYPDYKKIDIDKDPCEYQKAYGFQDMMNQTNEYYIKYNVFVDYDNSKGKITYTYRPTEAEGAYFYEITKTYNSQLEEWKTSIQEIEIERDYDDY